MKETERGKASPLLAFYLLLATVVMALSGFASGALMAAPEAAVLTWFAVSWQQQHVDVLVERDTAIVRADRAAFNAGFDQDWSAANATGRNCETSRWRK